MSESISKELIPSNLLSAWKDYVAEVEAENKKANQSVRDWNLQEETRLQKRLDAYNKAEKRYEERCDSIMAEIKVYDALPWYVKIFKDRPLYPFERYDLSRPWYPGLFPSTLFPINTKKPTIEEFLTKLAKG